MTMNKLTVDGPEIGDLRYASETYIVVSHAIFELPDGRWGIKLKTGAIIFEDDVPRAFTYDQIFEHATLRSCRLLQGTVVITYKA